jgi:proline iminopeptidase
MQTTITEICGVAMKQRAEIKTGGVKMVLIDGKYKVWTKKIGNSSVKMLTLHGGPGLTHGYFECFEDFLPQQGIEFYYYDQLGSAYSDQPKDRSLWTIERFRDEVEQVRKALGLESFYLYGHSWGGMLAIEYALEHQQHLKALVLSNTPVSNASMIGYMNELRQRFPPEAIEVLEKCEAKGEYDAPEYQAVLRTHLYAKHGCRVPVPEPYLRMWKNSASAYSEISGTMFGPSLFTAAGTAKDWNRWNDLRNIKVPTLVIGGHYDTVSPEDFQKMGDLIPSSRVAFCKDGSHLSMYDDQETYFRELIRFIKDVETDHFK